MPQVRFYPARALVCIQHRLTEKLPHRKWTIEFLKNEWMLVKTTLLTKLEFLLH